jgi:hypothetical protein
MGVPEKISWCFGGAPDAGEFGYPVRGNRHFKAGFTDCRADRVMSTACTKSGDGSFIIFFSKSEIVYFLVRMAECWDFITHKFLLERIEPLRL